MINLHCMSTNIFNTGIAKEFVVPGWRVGWLVLHDKGTGRLAEVATGIRNLSQIILGAHISMNSMFTLYALHCMCTQTWLAECEALWI